MASLKDTSITGTLSATGAVTLSAYGAGFVKFNASGAITMDTNTYLTGITSTLVTNALGFTPYNATNPSGYITSYTETDTLASVTGRGASTSTRTTFIELGVTKAGSDTVAVGPWFRWTNVGETRQMLTQLNASNGLTTWSYNGSVWASVFTLSQTGIATFNGSGLRPVTIDSNVNIKGDVGGWAMQYGFIGSSGTNRGGFGAFGGSDSLTYYYIGTYGSELFKLDTSGAAYVSGKISVGTTYAGFAANISGTAYIIAGNIILNNGYNIGNSSGNSGMIFQEGYTSMIGNTYIPSLILNGNTTYDKGDQVDWYLKPPANGPTIRMRYSGGTTNRNAALGWMSNTPTYADILTWTDSSITANVGLYANSNIVISNTGPTITFTATGLSRSSAIGITDGANMYIPAATNGNLYLGSNTTTYILGALSGNSTITATSGFVKTGYSDSYFLLAGGGTTPTSNYAPSTGGNYVAYRTQSTWQDGSLVINNVVGLLAWKNYGNNHVIFDASQGISPSGGGVSQANATNAWTASYPTLMGWNGSDTYGVRVDSARVADSSGNASNVQHLSGRTDGTYYNVGWFSGNPSPAYSCDAVQIQSSTGTLRATYLSTAIDLGITNSQNGNAASWYGRIISRNATIDKSVFIGTYQTVAVVGAHNNSLSAWADLYVNTVSGTTGGNIYMPSTTYVNGYAAVYNSGTWGISITGNAATVGGYAPSGPIGANTVVIRDVNNYIYAYYINSSVSESENPTINSFFTSNGDGWLRKASMSHVKSQMGLGSAAYQNTGAFASVNGSTGNQFNVFELSFASSNFNPSAGSRTTIDSMSLKMWNNYFNGTGLGSDYGIVMEYYGLSGHVNSQVYFDAAQGSWYRTASYNAGFGSWQRYLTDSNSPYAYNMNQYVRTTDNVSFARVDSTNYYQNSDGYFQFGFTNDDRTQWPLVRFGAADSGNGWDEGIIKANSSNGVFSRYGMGIHFSSSRAFGIYSSGWNKVMGFKSDQVYSYQPFYAATNVGIATAPLTNSYKLSVGGSLHMNYNSVDYVNSLYLERSGQGVHITGNDTGSYGSLRVQDTRNGWYGIYFDSGTMLMMNANESGHYYQGYGWQYRWYNGNMYISTASYGGGTEYTVLHTGNYRSNLDSIYFYNRGFGAGYPSENANTMPENCSAFTYSNNAPLTGCIAYFGASGYGIQLNGDYGGNSFSMRSRNGDNATWRPWKRLLTDYNYGDYALPLGGGTMSGTINLGGNNITNTQYVYGGIVRLGDMWAGNGLYVPSSQMVFGTEGGNGWSFQSGAVQRAYFGGDGNLWMQWAGAYISTLLDNKQNASTAITTSNIGSQSVAYASSAGSVAWGNVSSRPGWLAGGSYIASHSNANEWRDSGFYENGGGGSNWPSQTWYNSVNVRHSNQANYHGFQIAMSYYDNNLWFRSYQGSGSFQSWAYAISSANIGSQSVSYASNSGGLEGYSRTNFLGKNGNSYYQVDTWLQLNGVHGLYCPGTNGAHWYPNTNSSYTTWSIAGSRGGYGGIHDGYSAVQVSMFDSAGNGGTYREANGRWYWYYHLGNACMGINTSTTSSSYAMYVNGNVYATGDITAYSDRRKKENICTVDSALEKVLNLRGVFYNKIDDTKKKRLIGVIAQETELVLPEVVTYAADVDEYGVTYGNMAGLFIQAIKEQQIQIEELKNKLDEFTRN